MGELIKGPWKRQETRNELSNDSANESVTLAKHGPAIDYPWHTLTAPPKTSSEEYVRTLTDLKRLAQIAGNSGGILCLPKGWFWDPNKNESLINQLASIFNKEESEFPDDIA